MVPLPSIMGLRFALVSPVHFIANNRRATSASTSNGSHPVSNRSCKSCANDPVELAHKHGKPVLHQVRHGWQEAPALTPRRFIEGAQPSPTLIWTWFRPGV
jgi:hypothetical protein